MNCQHGIGRKILSLAVCCLPLTLPTAAEPTAGLTPALRTQLGLPKGWTPEFVRVAVSPNRGDTADQAEVNAPDILRLEACHVGQRRLLFKVTFARKPDFATAHFILYADMDNNRKTGRVDKYHGGVDVMITAGGESVSAAVHNPAYAGKTTLNAALEGPVLWLAVDAPLHVVEGHVVLGVHLLSQRQGGVSDSTPHVIARLPYFGQRPVPAVKTTVSAGLRPLSAYRYYDDKVKLEKLEDKGLTYDQVAPKHPIRFGRPRPPLPLSGPRRPGKAGTATRRAVPVELLEEAGVSRRASPITFGFPLPRGALFEVANMRVLSPDGEEVPAQFTVTSFWPDGSLKWVLIQFAAPLAAGQRRRYTVEFGSAVKSAGAASPLRVNETDDALTVVTGPLRAVIDKRRFNVLKEVQVDRNGDGRFTAAERVAVGGDKGAVLVDETGNVFGSALKPPRSVRLEQRGPQEVVVRVEGEYANAKGDVYQSYISRLRFRTGSTRVTVAWTHVDTWLKTEFTDFTSLSLPLTLATAPRKVVYAWESPSGGKQTVSGSPQDESGEFYQWDSAHFARLPKGKLREGRGLGTATLQGGGPVAVAVHDFWQRWPKGFVTRGNRFTVELLPPQPGPEFGRGLPHWLFFPFVEGRYRLKWGMSFTERVTFDFAGDASAEELAAEVNTPVVPVLPAEWYAETLALGPVAAPKGKQFVEWDRYVAAGFDAYMKRKQRYREYGFLNYGDWYGERGRNWGNNEYDLAHGLFMQFARTGDRRYFRWAVTAARHQADVDCVHAYPDPFYVGANHQHSIGHTGTWSQVPRRATWSHKYDTHTDARNGHTWSEGMVEAWYLAGEPQVMEAALALGEHITWAMSRDFHSLGTHERTAGWSLKAILALYRATGDPLYLQAAKRIVAVPLREQKFDQGGAWPHLLPRDHAGGHPGAVGNNLFLIGILLSGLEDYHEVTHDPAAAKSLVSGARWVLKSWDEEAEGWPYSASPTGEPYYPARTSLNTLILAPLAYAGLLTGDEKFIHVAETALGAVVRGGPESFGKSLAQRLVFTGGALALLQQWEDKHRPDHGLHLLDGSAAGMAEFFRKTPAARRFTVRAPDDKLFWVKLTADHGTLIAVRTPHGAKPKAWPKGTIQVFDAQGRLAARDEYSTDTRHRFQTDLSGRRGALFRVLIHDDQRAVWDVSGRNVAVVAQLTDGFSLGGVGRSRFYFFVPAHTASFKVELTGVHEGAYGAAVMTPQGRVVASCRGTNPGQVQLPWAPVVGKKQTTHPERATLVVKPAAADAGAVWSLVLWAAGDIRCQLRGVPPYLSRRAEDWFQPPESEKQDRPVAPR